MFACCEVVEVRSCDDFAEASLRIGFVCWITLVENASQATPDKELGLAKVRDLAVAALKLICGQENR